jgi:hypothetical protein
MLEGVFSLSKIRKESLSWPKDYYVSPPDGFFGGGTSIHKFDQSTETISQVSTLNQKRQSPSGSGNRDFGYFCGGMSDGLTNSIEKFAFMTSTAKAVSMCLNQARHQQAGVSTTDHGWHSGGLRDPNAQATTPRMDRIDHTNDTESALQRCNLISFRSGHSSLSHDQGWWLGGLQDPLGCPLVILSSIEKFSYQNDTEMISARGELSTPRDGSRAENNRTHGFVAGGDSKTICKIDFATDTVSVSIAESSVAMRDHASTGDGSSTAWFVGSVTDKLSMATETMDSKHSTYHFNKIGCVTNR